MLDNEDSQVDGLTFEEAGVHKSHFTCMTTNGYHTCAFARWWIGIPIGHHHAAFHLLKRRLVSMVIVFAAAPVIVDTMFYHASGKTEDPQEKKIHRSGGPTSRMFS